MKKILIKEYKNTILNPKPPLHPKNSLNVDFVNGCKVEINGNYETKYKVQFINQLNNDIVYEATISNNMWCKTNIRYFIDFIIKVEDLTTGKIAYEHIFNAKDKKVYIHLASKALGDTLAWVPYLKEFKDKHKCELVVSTFHNKMFNTQYPDIKFVEPGTEIFGLYAMYEIGWHYQESGEVQWDCNPQDFKKYPLQQTATDVLGLEYTEIKPKTTFINKGSKIEGDYVCIAPHASAHAKYWMYPGGWQKIIDYLRFKGYKVVIITQEPLNDEWHDSKLGGTLKNVIDKTGDYSLSERANDLMNAKAFIGLGSGLSWLSWAVGCPTILISGFSEYYSEFKDCERISPPSNKCKGCFNKYQLDAGDWEWCPEHKDTNRHFECTKSITPEIVIKAINNQLE